MTGIDAVFSQELPEADLYVEYLDTKRNPPGEMFAELERLFEKKYRDAVFDVIMVSDDNALNLLMTLRDKLFPGTPVVYCGINDPTHYDLNCEMGFTGVVENAHLPTDIRQSAKSMRDAKQSLELQRDAPARRPKRMPVRQEVPPEKRRPDKSALDKDALLTALEQANGNKSEAARILGISRRHLYRKIAQFGITT